MIAFIRLHPATTQTGRYGASSLFHTLYYVVARRHSQLAGFREVLDASVVVAETEIHVAAVVIGFAEVWFNLDSLVVGHQSRSVVARLCKEVPLVEIGESHARTKPDGLVEVGDYCAELGYASRAFAVACLKRLIACDGALKVAQSEIRGQIERPVEVGYGRGVVA